MDILVQRVAAVDATIKKFNDCLLVYGKSDCVKMSAFALKQQGRKIAMARIGQYSNALGAARVLKKLGYETVLDAVDGEGLIRIAPASALPGDLIALPAEHFGGALFLVVGNGRAFGYFDGKFQVGQPKMFEAAWRSIDNIPLEPTAHLFNTEY